MFEGDAVGEFGFGVILDGLWGGRCDLGEVRVLRGNGVSLRHRRGRGGVVCNGQRSVGQQKFG